MTVKEHALAFVNSIRERQGRKPLKRLPRGSRRNPCYCPIARAVSYTHRDYGFSCKSIANVQNAGYQVFVAAHIKGETQDRILTGDYNVAAFLHQFDHGHFPELVKR